MDFIRHLTSLSRWRIAGIAACIVWISPDGHGQTFKALGIAPADLGMAISRSPLWQRDGFDGLPSLEGFSLSGLPVSKSEREQTLAGFREVRWQMTPQANRYVAEVLEGWGMLRECRDWLQADGAPGFDPLNLVRLHWRLGDLAAAEDAFSRAQHSVDNRFPRLFRRGTDLIRPLVAARRFEDLAQFLHWLQPRCHTSVFHREILSLRLNLAWHQNTLDAELARIRGESVIFGHCADWQLSKNAAKLPENLSALAPDDLILIYRFAPEVPAIINAVQALLENRSLTLAQRADLLLALQTSRQHVDPLFTRLLNDDALALATLEKTHAEFLGAEFYDRIPAEIIWALADRHPTHAPVNLLAGARHSRHAPREKVIEWLTRAFVQSPLLDAPPALDSFAPFHAAHRFDPAAVALARLANLLDPATLLATLRQHPDFAKSPPHQQARHFAIARLDRPFLETLIGLDWQSPQHDSCPSWALHYFLHLRVRSADSRDPLVARFAAAIPAMVTGSPQKDPAALRYHATALPNLLGSRESPVAASTARDPLAVLSCFGPPQLFTWLELGHRDFMPWSWPEKIEDAGTWLTHPLSACLRPIRAFADHWDDYGLAPQMETIWKLRRFLPAETPHALALDSAAHLGYASPVPADIAAAAATHVAKFSGSSRDPDWLALQHAENLRLEKPIRWEQFENLFNEPLPIRKIILGFPIPPDSRTAGSPRDLLRQRFMKDVHFPPTSEVVLAEQARSAERLRLERLLIRDRQTTTNEAQTLARSILDSYLESGRRFLGYSENQAIRVLFNTKSFDTYKAEVARRLMPLPDAEIATARAMHALHLFSEFHQNGESLEFAHTLLKLDPTDPPALLECAFSAIQLRDADLLLTVFDNLSKSDLRSFVELFCMESVRKILTTDQIGKVIALFEQPLPETQQRESLHAWRYPEINALVLKNTCIDLDTRDPNLTDRFICQLIKFEAIPADKIRAGLVPFCAETKRQSIAVALLAPLLIDPLAPTAASREPHFPTAGSHLFTGTPEIFQASQTVIENGLARDIILHFANLTTPRPPPDIGAALRHAADPTREQFTAEILPLLEPLPRSERTLAAQNLAKFLEALPGADQRKLWIHEPDPNTPSAE